MTKKNKFLITTLVVILSGSALIWIAGRNPFALLAPGLIALFLLYALWDPPKKYRIFSYKDQQRAMRAFDRSEQIDMGKPDWGKEKEKHKK
jgi:hypothetical protein